MSAFILASILLFSTNSHASNTGEDARNLIASIDLYQPTLNALKSLSSSTSEITERDLVMCMIIGEAKKEAGNVAEASWQLMRSITDKVDQAALDKLGYDLVVFRGAMQRFCHNVDVHDFRQVKHILQKTSESEETEQKLKKIAEKYLP